MPSLTLLCSAKVINYTQVIMVLSLRMQLEVRLPGFYQPNETKKCFSMQNENNQSGYLVNQHIKGQWELPLLSAYTKWVREDTTLIIFLHYFLTRDQNNNDKSPIGTTSVDPDNNSNPSIMRCLANQHSATWSNKTGKRNKARAYKHRPEGPQL